MRNETQSTKERLHDAPAEELMSKRLAPFVFVETSVHDKFIQRGDRTEKQQGTADIL